MVKLYVGGYLKNEIIFTIFLFSLSLYQSEAQSLEYPVVGQYKNQTSQGMAIFDNKAYLLNNTGICRVYNLKDEVMECEFLLASADNNNHANSACFGKDCIDSGSLPVMYITECGRKKRCFVEKIQDGKSKLIQTISATVKSKDFQAFLWTVDRNKGFLYGVTRDDIHPIDVFGTKINTIVKFRLPRLDEGKEIVLTDKDLIDSFSVAFPNLLQGGKVKGHYLYISLGLQESSKKRKDSGRAIAVIDLKRRKLKKFIDLTKITVNEPEDIDFHKNYILLWCGQQGGLYKVKY